MLHPKKLGSRIVAGHADTCRIDFDDTDLVDVIVWRWHVVGATERTSVATSYTARRRATFASVNVIERFRFASATGRATSSVTATATVAATFARRIDADDTSRALARSGALVRQLGRTAADGLDATAAQHAIAATANCATCHWRRWSWRARLVWRTSTAASANVAASSVVAERNVARWR